MCQHLISTAPETHSFAHFREKNTLSTSDQKGDWKNYWDILDFSWIAHEWWAKHLSWMPFRRCGNDYFVRGHFLSNRNTVIEHAVGNSVTTVVTTHSDIADVTLLKKYICVLWPMMQDSCGVKCVTTIPIESSHLQLDIDTGNWWENSDYFANASSHQVFREWYV